MNDNAITADQLIRQIHDAMKGLPPAPPDPFAFAPFRPFGGIQVVESENLPREQIGHWIEPLHAPRWFAFILGLFGISSVTWNRWPMYDEGRAYMLGNRLFCTPYFSAVLRRDRSIFTGACTS